MKYLSLLAIVFLAGCQHTQHRVPPSSEPTRAAIVDAEGRVTKIQTASGTITVHAANTRTLADRIDSKASVILDHWSTAP